MGMKEKRYGKILVMTAVEAEKDAVLRGLKEDERFDVALAHVGPASAAANTAFTLANSRYELVISAGIGGGFVGRAEVGSVTIANESIAADLGVETGERFLTVTELGFGENTLSCDEAAQVKVKKALEATEIAVHTGAILTVSTVTGTKERANALLKRYPNAIAEAMEGFGVAIAAKQMNIPFLEVRTISNAVGPRNREQWRIGDALIALEKTATILSEVL